MKEWDVSVTKTVKGRLKVSAETEEEARRLADEQLSMGDSAMTDVDVKTRMSLESSDLTDGLHVYEVLLGADLSGTFRVVAKSESDAYDEVNGMVNDGRITDGDLESKGIYVAGLKRLDNVSAPPILVDEYVAAHSEGLRDFTVKATLVLELFERIVAESKEAAREEMEDRIGRGEVLTSDYETKDSYISVVGVHLHKG